MDTTRDCTFLERSGKLGNSESSHLERHSKVSQCCAKDSVVNDNASLAEVQEEQVDVVPVILESGDYVQCIQGIN